MTVLFNDVKTRHTINNELYRPMGCNQDEVLYADDTIVSSTDTRVLEKQLHKIEEVASNYGLTLSRKNAKC